MSIRSGMLRRYDAAYDGSNTPSTAASGDRKEDMRATLIYGKGDIRVEEVPDAALREPADALVRVTTACICGSDLHPYHSKPDDTPPGRIGHEFIGVVEDIGSDVRTVSRGDLVVAPFAFSCGACEFCHEGLHTSCVRGGFWANGDLDGGQGEAVRVPLADGTLVRLPVAEDSALIPSLLTLSDVLGTGWHAAVRGRVTARTTVTVIGDGAVGLLAVLSAKRLGAERIILMGRHRARTDLGREFGATDVVAERGEEGVEAVRELTGGQGTHVVLEAVGYLPAYEQAYGVVRAGGTISRVGVPQYGRAPIGFSSLFGRNITLTGGPAPARAYVEELMPAILDGEIEPGKVFDRTVGLDDVPDGYRAMDSREALKVLVEL
jgi:threonine dehydrogenase-like Zn-dependent dehydrogenase